MTAWYNEIDPYAAQWLRNLIAAGHIAPGVVDERDIRDIKPDELEQYTQCHFFAGIGVWSHALRLAGWPDERPVWTGSCPCQPFSAAGRRAGFADERHLWPAWHHLIAERMPAELFGEQVAGKDGGAWLDLVQADLEGVGYACGAIVSPAAGYGAPHLRHRQYFAAYRLADTDDARSQGRGRTELRECAGQRAARSRGAPSGVEYPHMPSEHQRAPSGKQPLCKKPNPTNGHWRAADWIGGKDGNFRPVEPGTFPLADGAPARMGRLRAYGNAICAPQAKAFIEAYLETQG